MGSHYFSHQDIVILGSTEKLGVTERRLHAFALLGVVQCREQLLQPEECRLTVVAAAVASGCEWDPRLRTRKTVSSVGVTVPGAVTRTAAILSESKVSHHASVTVRAGHPRFTGAPPTAGVTVGTSRRDRAQRVAQTQFTRIRCSFCYRWVPVVPAFAHLTVSTFGVVEAVIADASTSPTRRQPQRTVQVASLSMPIALAFLALLWGPSDAVGRLPRPVVVKRSAVLAVVTGCVVATNTFPVDHVVCLLLVDADWNTVVCMPIAKTASLHNKIINCVMFGR